MIKRLLIANRGEIACRIIRTAKKLGVTTIAVYSDPDLRSQHVLQASEAYALGGKTASETYLNAAKILAIAREANVDAIHPGYGFLSEDGDFCRSVTKAGFIFVGPSSENIDLMGNKERAKSCVREVKLPVAADFGGDIEDIERFQEAGKQIGYPLLVKASAGGGGKGMRLVQSPEELHEALQAAAHEAKASFGDGSVFLEQYIHPARHIEVQIARDHKGNAIHLYTRECSIQRRHQKVIEEAPAHIPKATQEAMCEASIKLAHHMNYLGLGTLEFLLDSANRFYFMEMNTRLQVEHPITELVTQEDCVALQLAIAAGDRLPKKQSEIRCQGHAIEARICAETPLQDFLPSSGRLEILTPPTNARFDTGVVEGDVISPFYDSMIAKVITHGKTRSEAIQKLHEALKETHIVGLNTNVEFVDAILQSRSFQEESICTEFIVNHKKSLERHITALSEEEKQRALKAYLDYRLKRVKRAFSNDYFSPWLAQDNWRAMGSLQSSFMVSINGEIHKISPPLLRQSFDEKTSSIYELKDFLHLFIDGKHLRISMGMQQAKKNSTINHSALTSPMPGTITQILVSAGDHVSAGQTLVCLEAMKMEHRIKAPTDGVIKTISVKVGDITTDNHVLVTLN